VRQQFINFLKVHPVILKVFWTVLRGVISVFGIFVPINKKKIIFSSLGGRNFDDSPRAIYDEVIERKEFNDWTIVWAFVNPNEYNIPRGKKVKIDTIAFFIQLLSSYVWIANSGMDRGIEIKRRGIIRVETWHGTPIKKICGEENEILMANTKSSKQLDRSTIRCAQSEFDKTVFMRVFNAAENAVLLSGVPRNDNILSYTQLDVRRIKKQLSIPQEKKVLFYTPTYREYLLDEKNQTYIAPPLTLDKWKKVLGDEYVFLIRAHYAVVNSLNIQEDDFVKDVSQYPAINDLYAIADMMISDYSSTFVDFSILDRPMFCFAYDLEEYKKKRGLYLDLKKDLPCLVDEDENTLLEHIKTVDYKMASDKTKKFHQKYATYVGEGSKRVVDEIVRRI